MVELEIDVVPSSSASEADSVLQDTKGDHPPDDPLLLPNSATPQSNLILGLLPFTVRGGKFHPSSFSHMAAGLMALDHFHEANSMVVPELAANTNNSNCSSVALDLRFLDTGADSTKVAEFLMQQVAFQWPLKPMAMVGVPSNDAALTAAEYAVGMKLPLVSSGADSTSLTNGRWFNGLGASTNVNLHVMGQLIMDYIVKRQGRRQVLATLATTHEFGADLRYAIETESQAAMCGQEEPCFVLHQSYGLSPPFGGYDPNRGAGWALQQIQAAGIRNIVLILNAAHAQLGPIANDAMELGFLSEERRGNYVWILAAERGQRLTELTELAAINRNVSLLLEGMATVVPLDGFDHDPTNDAFLQAWKQQNETMVERLNQLYPIQSNSTPGYYQAPNDYFQTHDPQPGAGFFYDAVMTVAMGKCALEQKKKDKPSPSTGQGGGDGPPNDGEPGQPQGGGQPDQDPLLIDSPENAPPPPSQNDNTRRHRNLKRPRRLKGVQQPQLQLSARRLQPPKKKGSSGPKNEYMEAIEDVKFMGATGPIEYGESSKFPGSRPRDLVTYGVYNFRSNPTSTVDAELQVRLTDIHQGPFEQEGAWRTAPDGPFIYPNGLSTPPVLNRDLPEQNYLSPAIQITGLVFFSLALLAALASSVLVLARFNAEPIRQAQPPFLLLLILGTILMAFAMLTTAFDESFGFTDAMLDAACTATPFLLCLGYNIIYLALFSKLYRINRVMQFRRVQITVTRVVGPFVVNMLLTVGLLIAWTVVDPYVWVRTIVDPLTMESYGKCQSNNPIPFLIPLLCLIGLSTLACAFMAYKCRDIDERFSDSNYIFYTIFVQIQVLLVGIPILIILDDASADAAYLGRALLIFVIVITTLTLMIAPKAYTIFVLGRSAKTSTSRRTMGGGQLHVSGLNVVSSGASTTGTSELEVTSLSFRNQIAHRKRSMRKSHSQEFAEAKREVEACIARQSESEEYKDKLALEEPTKKGAPTTEHASTERPTEEA